MERFSVGDIVLLPFPFSDLSQHKLRPALVLADAGQGDYLLCQITSQPYQNQNVVQLDQNSFTRGQLIKTSYVRPGKLFTAHNSIIGKVVAHLKPEMKREVARQVVALLNYKN